MEFRVLHISDVHFSDESTSQWVKRDEVIEQIRIKALQADCLVISGDIFHRGSLTATDAERCKDYIVRLKRQLGNPTVLVIPGNHDLDRLSRSKKENHYNIFANRRDLVIKASEEALKPGGEYSIGNNEINKKVLYKEAFDEFQRFSKEIGSGSFCSPDANPIPSCYEVQRVTLPFTNNKEYGIRFILLNTALFAGQAVHGEAYRKRKRTWELEQKKQLKTEI